MLETSVLQKNEVMSLSYFFSLIILIIILIIRIFFANNIDQNENTLNYEVSYFSYLFKMLAITINSFKIHDFIINLNSKANTTQLKYSSISSFLILLSSNFFFGFQVNIPYFNITLVLFFILMIGI